MQINLQSTPKALQFFKNFKLMKYNLEEAAAAVAGFDNKAY